MILLHGDNKRADQPRSLINTFVICSLGGIKINLYFLYLQQSQILASPCIVVEQTGLSQARISYISFHAQHGIQLLLKTTMPKKDLSCFKLTDVVLFLLIYVQMPTIVGILTFISRINFMLS